MSMKQEPIISYESFRLSFMNAEESDEDRDENEEEEYPEDSGRDIEEFESKLPPNAIFLGAINDEVENFTSWEINDHYYIITLKEDDYDWALFRISWDDNWGRFDWQPDARIKGISDHKEAAKLMLNGLFANWGHDLSEEEYAPYKQLLEEI